MGIYVNGMEMPKKCLWCPLQYIGFCQVTKTDVNSDLGRRADDCPLVEVPEPHGRLIDADMLMDDVKKNSASYFAEDFAREWLDVQPTVIEADGE